MFQLEEDRKSTHTHTKKTNLQNQTVMIQTLYYMQADDKKQNSMVNFIIETVGTLILNLCVECML